MSDRNELRESELRESYGKGWKTGRQRALREVRDALREITNGHTIMVGGREWLMHAMFDKGGRFEIEEEEA